MLMIIDIILLWMLSGILSLITYGVFNRCGAFEGITWNTRISITVLSLAVGPIGIYMTYKDLQDENKNPALRTHKSLLQVVIKRIEDMMK